jgi:hypothetical protein
MQNEQPIDLRAEYRAVNILCSALMIGVSLFLIISTVYVKWLRKDSQWDDSMDKIFLAVVSVIAVICLISAFHHYNKQMLLVLNSDMGLKQKLETYRAALIRFMALCEGPALFGVIAFFLTGNYWFVLITLCMLALMMIKKPTKSRMITELQLDSQQQIDLQ